MNSPRLHRSSDGWSRARSAGGLLAVAIGLCGLAAGVSAAYAATAEEGVAPPAIQRFALVVGANNGGADRVQLRYATADAQGFADVMSTYGGVEPERLLVVLDPDRDSVDSAFAELHRRIGEADGRTELLVFYSGHADEKGLLLSGKRLPYTDLRAHLEAMPADVRIAIIDACASGAMIRAKGGTRQAPFLIDRASRVTGHAYVASASADEAAQESDRLQASFFTHALLTGLRGAADVSDDGVVTLGEAYQFAFRETLSRTEGTRLGAQHPNYDMQLVGSGDVVLTDLRATNASLMLESELDGRVFVRDEQGRLIAELHKPGGQAMKLGLAPGSYRMRLDTTDGRRLEGALALSEGATTRMGPDGLLASQLEETRAMGGPPSNEAGAVRRLPPVDHPRFEAVGISVIPGVSTDGERSHRELSLNILAGRSAGIGGLGFGTLLNIVDERVEGIVVSGVGNIVGGPVEGILVAGVLNIAGGGSEGVSVAGLGNIVSGPVEGVLVGGAVNISGGGLQGVSVAGVANIAGGAVEGAQVSGMTSIASRVDGWQYGGVLSVAGDVSGVQLGLINIAGVVDGLQLGLINIAERVDGVSIALIPWIEEGRRHVELFGSELALMNVGARLGGGVFHTLISAGYQPTGQTERFNAAFGFGFDVVGEVLELDVDLLATAVFDPRSWQDKPDFLASARLLLGARFARHLAVYGGASWNVAANPRAFDPGFTPLVELRPDHTLFIDQWPGVVAGVRF